MTRIVLHYLYRACLFAVVGLVVLSGCRKEEFNESPDFQLAFSTDTVTFDTIFQSVGSATLSLKVYNRSNERVRISRISVVDSCNTYDPYRINVDGVPGSNFTDVEIGGKDSLFIFVEVTIDTSLVCNALETGVIEFETNGRTQLVHLLAYGLDAVFYTPTVFPTNGLPAYTLIDSTASVITWTADKPIVVYGYAVVDEGQKLIIEPGARIHFHQGSGLWVYQNASIQVGEEGGDLVIFQGDRLERVYAEEPGQWDRIWINEGSTDNYFYNTLIKNAFIGLQVEPLPFGEATNSLVNNRLILRNVVLRNHSVTGIYSRNYRIHARNVMLSNSGEHLLAGIGAGEYVFQHATFANNWTITARQTPAVYLTNLAQVDETTVGVGDIVASRFQNCIIHGNGLNEFDLDFETEGVNINLAISNTLLKMEAEDFEDLNQSYFQSGIHVGFNPGFQDFIGGDFRLVENAYARGKGVAIPGVTTDITGYPYASPPSLGSMEFRPE